MNSSRRMLNTANLTRSHQIAQSCHREVASLTCPFYKKALANFALSQSQKYHPCGHLTLLALQRSLTPGLTRTQVQQTRRHRLEFCWFIRRRSRLRIPVCLVRTTCPLRSVRSGQVCVTGQELFHGRSTCRIRFLAQVRKAGWRDPLATPKHRSNG